MSFYRKSRPSADHGTVFSGYDHADTIADAVEAYQRCRTTKHFILTDTSPDLEGLTCTCGHSLGEDPVRDGNRCQLVRRNGRVCVLAQHYACSWGTLLDAIGTSDNLAEAGRKLDRAQAGGWAEVAQ